MSKVRVMRKFYIIAISLFTLVGCRDSVETPRHTIGFASQVNRSIVEGVEDLRNGEGIKLFGTATLTSGDIIRLFDAEQLYFDTDLYDWNYVNTRYWAPQADHRFYALWPYDTNATFTDEDAKVTINHTADADGADLLYAVASRNLLYNEDYSTVSLSFRHACAALQFSIINASDAVVTNVSNIYLTGVQNKGTFTFDISGTSNWELDGSVVASTDRTTFGGDNLTNLAIDINTKHSLYAGGAVVVPPQEILNTEILLHLEIKKQGNATAEVKDVMLGKLGASAPIEWEAGKKYEYTLTVTENAIVSNVKVVPWIDHYVDL